MSPYGSPGKLKLHLSPLCIFLHYFILIFWIFKNWTPIPCTYMGEYVLCVLLSGYIRILCHKRWTYTRVLCHAHKKWQNEEINLSQGKFHFNFKSTYRSTEDSMLLKLLTIRFHHLIVTKVGMYNLILSSRSCTTHCGGN